MSSVPPITSVGNDSALRVQVDLGDVPIVMRQAPKIAHYWLQGFLFGAFRDHRVTWLRSKGTQFGRRSADQSKAIRVFPVNEGPAAPAEEDVIYRVTPAEQRAPSVEAARRGLDAMTAEAFAGSTVLRVHEFGEDIRVPRGFMAIPVKTRPKTPAKWLQKNPGKRLELRPSKKIRGEGALYEVRKVGRRGRPKKGQAPPTRDRLRLRFLLKRFVDMKPTLRMYATWDEMAEQRARRWAGASDRMIKQLQEGDPRDF